MKHPENTAPIDFSLSSQAGYYLEKYGDDALLRLHEAARFWEQEGKLKKRNAFLRLADEIQMEYPHLKSASGD